MTDEDHVQRHSTRGLSYIGEGLLDVSGRDAIDKYGSLDESNAASSSKLSSFLATEEPTASTNPPEEKEDDHEKRNKLLDFLANDVGEKYLDGVYHEEDRKDGEDLEDDTSSHEELPPSRQSRANSRLMAFLAHEKGEMLHQGENLSDSESHRNSFSSSTSSFRSRPHGSFDAGDQPLDSSAEQLGLFVQREADRKKLRRQQKELARQKVMKFLAEEEAEDQKHANETRVKAVDEASIQREMVVDRYGTSKLLDFLDTTEGQKQKQIKQVVGVTSRRYSPPSSLDHTSASDSEDNSSSDKETPIKKQDIFKRAGSKLSRFLHRSDSVGRVEIPKRASQSPEATKSPVSASASSYLLDKSKSSPLTTTPKPSPASPPKPSTSSKEVVGKTQSLVSTLRQIADTCEQSELNDVTIARVSTLLTSISQVLKDDSTHPTTSVVPIRRSYSNASRTSWVKSDAQKQAFDDRCSVEAQGQVSQPKANTSTPVEPEAEHTPRNVSSSVLDSFAQFETAQDLNETLAAFQTLLQDADAVDIDPSKPWQTYDRIRSAVYDKLGFRQRQLFKLLDTKLKQDVYAKRPAAGKKVLVVGAGPVGLRAAVELSMLGAQVTVLEKRKHFSRENILHLWPWVVQDLTSLGAKVFFPSFCHSTAYFHVGTRQLQCILLKVGLIMGLEMHPHTQFESLTSPLSSLSGEKPFYSVQTSPQIPWTEFHAVIGASGKQDKLSQQADMRRFVYSRKEAIGIVCYFPNLGTKEEKSVPEFSWTVQFKKQVFDEMKAQGLELENVVYYRGEMHYIVMTPKRQSLLDAGVLRQNYPNVSDLVTDANTDKERLAAYAQKVLDFAQIKRQSDMQKVKMFDFSTRTRVDRAASVLTSNGKKLYVGMIGDALIEPFWPEGLGSCRGFLAALDTAWMVAQAGRKPDQQILADRELAYRIIQHISGFRRDDLQKNVRKYNVDPRTRYTVKFPTLY